MKRVIKYVSIAIGAAIPIILIAYILLANVAPFGAKHDYFIDIGSLSEAGDARFTGPLGRVSEKLVDKNVSYRELEEGLIYFDVTDPLFRDASNVTVWIKFKDNFPEGQKFVLGGQYKEGWNYSWYDIYNPLYEEALNRNTYKMKTSQEFDKINFPSQDPIGVIQAPFVRNTYNRIEDYSKSESSILYNTTIRGAHTMFAYISNEPLNMTFMKQDLNWYNGSDVVEINVYDENGDLVNYYDIQDDGNANEDHIQGPEQKMNFYSEGLKTGVYKIEIKYLNIGDDAYITLLETTNRKIVFQDRIFIISSGTVYLPENIGYTRMQTYHNEGLQDIKLNDAVATINETGKWFGFNIPETDGLVTVTMPKGDIILEAPLISLSEDSYFQPTKYVFTEIRSISQLDNFEYIVFGADYNPVAGEEGWLIGTTSWNVKDLYVNNDRLSFVMNVPHLSRVEYSNYTIPVDWIKISVRK